LADRLGRRSLQELRGTQEPTGKTGLWGVGGFWFVAKDGVVVGFSPLKRQQGCRTPRGASFGEPSRLAGKLALATGFKRGGESTPGAGRDAGAIRWVAHRLWSFYGLVAGLKPCPDAKREFSHRPDFLELNIRAEAPTPVAFTTIQRNLELE
jgi:hypothetical protein